MKKILATIMIMAVGLITFSCAHTGYNTQKGAAIGAGLGAIAGQAIGRNTAGTLIGLAGGALAGAILGNAVDQDMTYQQMGTMERQRTAAAYSSANGAGSEAPPGEWVTVPGRWVNGRWVPAHRAWVPINP
jgi:uncharacterized protein YcfJ